MRANHSIILVREKTAKIAAMKYLVFSDLHGSMRGLDLLKRAISFQNPDVLLCLGDISYGSYDQNSSKVFEFFQNNKIPTFAVKGNCDLTGDSQFLGFGLPAEFTLPNGNKTLYLIHYPVYGKFKRGYIVCYGHTHCKVLNESNGVIYLNPGSIAKPRDGEESYATIEDHQICLFDANDQTILQRLSF